MPTVLPEKEGMLLPEAELQAPSVLLEDDAFSLAEQAAHAKESLGGQYSESFAEALPMAQDGRQDALRDAISREEMEIKKQEASQAVITEAGSANPDAELIAGNLLALSSLVQNSAAVEQQALKNIDNRAQSPDLIELKKKNQGVRAKAIEDLTKLQIVHNKISEIRALEEAEGLGQETADFFGEIFLKDAVQKIFGFDELTYVSQLKQFSSRVNEASPEEVPGILEEQLELIKGSEVLWSNPDYHAEMLELGQLGSDTDAALSYLFTGADAALTLAGSKVLAGAINKLSKTRVALGDETVVTDVINKSDNIRTDAEAADLIMTLKPAGDDVPGVAPKVKEQLDRQARVLEQVLEKSTAPEFTNAKIARELAQEATEIKQRIRNVAPDLGIDVDTGKFVKDFQNDVIKYDIYAARGEPFADKESAQFFQEAAGLTDSTVTELPTGGFVVRNKTKLDGWNYPENHEKISVVGQWLNNVENIVNPKILSLSRQAEGSTGQVQEALNVVWKESFKKLGRSRKDVIRLLKQQTDASEWYNSERFRQEYKNLTGRDPSDKEILANSTYKQLNDFAYLAENNVKYQRAIGRGEKEYSFQMPDGSSVEVNARVVPFPSRVLQGEGEELSNSTYLFMPDFEQAGRVGRTFAPGELKVSVYLDTHKLVEIDKDHVASLARSGNMTDRTQYALVPKETPVADLRPAQIAYRAGGRRFYNQGAFVKITSTGKYSDGKAWRANDTALFAANGVRQAGEYAKKLSEAFDLTRKVRSQEIGKEGADTAISRLKLQHLNINGVDDIERLAVAKGVNLDRAEKVAGVTDRELIDTTGTGFQTDLTDDAFRSNLASSFNSPRGAQLQHVDGDLADVIDPVASIARSVDTATEHLSFASAKEQALEFMQVKFGRVLNHDPNSNPINLLYANVDENIAKSNPALARAAQTHQRFLQLMFQRRSKWEMEWQAKVENAVDWAFDSEGLSKSLKFMQDWGVIDNPRTARQGAKKALGQEPGSKVRGTIFHMKLGLFNPASFSIQAINAVNAIAIAPKLGLQAAMRAWPVRTALHQVDPGEVKFLAGKWKALGFRSEEDFIDYVDEFRAMGFNNFGRNLSYIDGANSSQIGSSRLQMLAEHGQVFFNEGERLSRLTAYGVARERWLLQNHVGLDGKTVNSKGLPANSAEGRAWIQNETHRIALGFTRSDVQIGFRGIAAIPTQFWSYPFRFVGAVLPNFAGGRSFTGPEKAKLLGAYMLLFGTAGVPVLDTVSEYMFSSTGTKLPPEAYKAARNGVIDGLVFAATDGETNTNFASRAGPGQFFTDLIKNFSEDPFARVAGGASGQTIYKGFGAITDMASLFSIAKDPSIETVSDATVQVLVSGVSSFSLAYKAYHGSRTGYLYDGKNRKLSRVSQGEIAAMIAGLPPQTYENMSRLFLDEAARKEIMDDATKHILRLYRDWEVQAEQDDRQAMRSIEEQINLISLNLMQDGLNETVMRRVNAEFSTTGMMDRMIEKLNKVEASRPEEADPRLSGDVNVQEQEQ